MTQKLDKIRYDAIKYCIAILTLGLMIQGYFFSKSEAKQMEVHFDHKIEFNQIRINANERKIDILVQEMSTRLDKVYQSMLRIDKKLDH